MLFIHFCIFVKVRQFLHVAYSRPTILFKEWIARWFWALSLMIPVAFIFIYACVTAPNTARRWRLLFQLLKFGWLIINTPSHKFKLDLRVNTRLQSHPSVQWAAVLNVDCCIAFLGKKFLQAMSFQKQHSFDWDNVSFPLWLEQSVNVHPPALTFPINVDRDWVRVHTVASKVNMSKLCELFVAHMLFNPLPYLHLNLT